MTNEDKVKRFNTMVEAFDKAIRDRLKEVAAKSGGVYQPRTDTLKAAAFDALNEVVESEAEPVSAMLAVAVWEAVMKVNESAYRQGLVRLEKAGTLGFKVGGGERAPQTMALQYV